MAACFAALTLSHWDCSLPIAGNGLSVRVPHGASWLQTHHNSSTVINFAAFRPQAFPPGNCTHLGRLHSPGGPRLGVQAVVPCSLDQHTSTGLCRSHRPRLSLQAKHCSVAHQRAWISWNDQCLTYRLHSCAVQGILLSTLEVLSKASQSCQNFNQVGKIEQVVCSRIHSLLGKHVLCKRSPVAM